MKEIFENGMQAWKDMENFRRQRKRCKRYVYGEQWDDLVEVEGRKITEKQYILEQGQNPLKNNILRRIVRNVVGVYRSNYKVPSAAKMEAGMLGHPSKTINSIRKYVFDQNRMDQLLPRLLEEFLISGLSVVKINKRGRFSSFENPLKLNEREFGVNIQPVTTDNFFFHSDGYDPRGWDIDLIGEIHNVNYMSLISRFCRDDEEMDKIERLYSECRDSNQPCRLTEVWHKTLDVMAIVHDKDNATISRMTMAEVREKYKGRRDRIEIRKEISEGWRCTWYAHDGSKLREEKVAHSHPYVWKVYPFIDGEVHSYVSDIIDQQHYVNHLITLYDFIMRSSAKGVLLFPEESMPRGMTLQDVANEWSRFNGVLPYRAQPGVPLPAQVSGNAANIGITELLSIEMQLMEDISGVSPTLRGKLENTAASGTLFAQQNQAAMTSILDVVKSFEDFVSEIAVRIFR